MLLLETARAAREQYAKAFHKDLCLDPSCSLSIWRHCHCQDLLWIRDKIRILMNKMFRLSTNTSLADRKRTNDLYKSLEFLSWDSLLATQILNLLWKLIVYHTPKHLSVHLTVERTRRALGMRTRPMANPYHVPLTRDNQVIFKQRSSWQDP